MQLLIKNTYTVLEILKILINEGDIVIDATAGNGYDTLALARIVGDAGKVYAFDIQKVAINIACEKIKKEGLEKRVDFINDSHANVDVYVKEKIKAATFNLGYLPNEDKKITTKGDTTVESICKCIKLLDDGGVISIVGYLEQENGKEEIEKVEEYLSSLDDKKYQVVKISKINNKKSPISYFIFS